MPLLIVSRLRSEGRFTTRLTWFRSWMSSTTSCSLPSVAIIGRPNCGKSTLFNRLTGRRRALVHERPGMTRDRLNAIASLFDLRFRLIDTPGLDDGGLNGPTSLDRALLIQSQLAVEQADVVLFLFDAREGITPNDEFFARWLRQRLGKHSDPSLGRRSTPVVLVANKCEGHVTESTLMESERLGFGSPVPISAVHGDGRLRLFRALNSAFQQIPSIDMAETETALDSDHLRLAIVGRPNVGKSTLVNGLVRDPTRCLTGPMPGLTRDSVTIELQHDGHRFELVDTAGLTRVTPVSPTAAASGGQHDPMDVLGMDQSLRSMRFANVVGLVVDAAELARAPSIFLPRREAAIAKHVIDNGRCLIMIANKWDQVPDKRRSELLRRLREAVIEAVPQAGAILVEAVSALELANLNSVLRSAIHVHDSWNRRISTGLLNRWLNEWLRTATLPLGKGGRRLKVRYLTQVKARPPTFCLFGSRGLDQHDNFIRDLSTALRREFDLDGVPIRVLCRSPENPYVSAGRDRPVRNAATAAAAVPRSEKSIRP